MFNLGIFQVRKNIFTYIYTEGYNDSTELLDAVKYFASGEIRTHDHDYLPSTTPGIDATNCATEKDLQKKDAKEALILSI